MASTLPQTAAQLPSKRDRPSASFDRIDASTLGTSTPSGTRGVDEAPPAADELISLFPNGTANMMGHNSQR